MPQFSFDPPAVPAAARAQAPADPLERYSRPRPTGEELARRMAAYDAAEASAANRRVARVVRLLELAIGELDEFDAEHPSGCRCEFCGWGGEDAALACEEAGHAAWAIDGVLASVRNWVVGNPGKVVARGDLDAADDPLVVWPDAASNR